MNNQSYQRTRHWVQLKELGYIGASLAKINSIERYAHKNAELYANGEITEHEYSKREMQASNRVASVFGGQLPKGFFINGDPRGYALKLDDEAYEDIAPEQRPISYTDWGGYMILAPEI